MVKIGGCLQFGATINELSINICAQVFVYTYAFVYLEIISMSRMDMISNCLIIKTCQTVFQSHGFAFPQIVCVSSNHSTTLSVVV